MTNTILAAITYIQIVTNWGPIEIGTTLPKWSWDLPGVDKFVKNDFGTSGENRRQSASVVSQEVCEITLPGGAVLTNILNSTELSTITKDGHRCPDIIWDTTNVHEIVIFNWNTGTTNYITNTNSISNIWSYVTCTNTIFRSETISTASNTINLNEVAEVVRRSKMTGWQKIKEWWKRQK